MTHYLYRQSDNYSPTPREWKAYFIGWGIMSFVIAPLIGIGLGKSERKRQEFEDNRIVNIQISDGKYILKSKYKIIETKDFVHFKTLMDQSRK